MHRLPHYCPHLGSPPLQAFGPALAAQVAEPLQFVDYLREPRRDEATGEVVEARPRWAGRLGGLRGVQ